MAFETRIDRRFAALRKEGRAGLVTFLTAGDPDYEISRKILMGLAGAGADIIELGMPFSDPMADGPAIQEASQRALKAGMTLKRTLQLVAEFRAKDSETPIVLAIVGPLKVQPLADWNARDVYRYLELHHVPEHPLFEQGYVSVGCAPCTRAVMPGEDERSGH